MARRKAAAPVNTATSTDIVPVGKGGAFLAHVVGHLAGKALPYAAPWAGAAALPPLVGWATNSMWGDAPLSAGLASAALAVGGAALTGIAWKTTPAGSAYGRFRRAQVSASVAAGMGWLTTATAAGPFGSPVLDAWLIGGGLFAASWNVRQLVRNGASGDVETEETGGMAALAAAIGWEKVAVKSPKGTGKGTVKAAIEVAPSTTVDEVQATAGRAAAALKLPPSGVVITKDPEDASKGTISLRVADLLKDGIPFAPPVAMGLLPTDDIPLGLYADGEVWAINPFAAAILQHLLVMGVTGAGKSEMLRGLVTHLATRCKISIFLVDLAKGRQTVGHIADGIDWLIQDAKEAKRMLRALPAAIKARGDVLASEGLDQWTPDSSLNAVVVWVEEAADVADFQELEETARKARSVGIWLAMSLQRATWTNLSTDIRANLQATMCFGVNEAGDAGFCLPDRVTAAGAVPDWGSDRPGYAYSTGMGIPQDRWTTEVRSGLTDRDELAALVQAGAAYRDPLDRATADALGQAYAQRTHKGTNRTTPGIPAVPAPAALEAAEGPYGTGRGHFAHDHQEDDHMSAAEQAAEMELQEAYDEVMGSIPGDPEPDAPYASLRLEDDVPGDDEDDDEGMEFEAPARVGTEEARHILYTELDTWVQQGRLEFEPADLIPATTAAGRKRPWMQGELRRLVEHGLIQRDGHGSYTILHSPLQPA
ncbi:FtsK/SpoIIIE domain-containing protein [Streptomyces sp. NRRL F-5702]|uniref:FtsK/SpoIIIE domain-containing protein n=1 Tax=Streptomyces sp. NRRL F-5702 TaxID=1463870 RepID=UPI0004C623E7|nr:FtsK/SpoIIIE domain-containing protein [Streptomyces sp. NRRL F-5702]